MRNSRIAADGSKKPAKVNLRKNGKADIEKAKLKDKGKIPLRIDERTIIYVHPKNHNEKYAAKYRERMNRVNYAEYEFKNNGVF